MSHLISVLFIILIIMLGILAFLYLDAYAATGIILSKTCLTMIKNNFTTSCPGYEEILTLFPDTLNTKIAGKFAYTDGHYHRLHGRYGDSFDYYRYSNLDGNYIDPPQSLAARIKTITIESNDFIYKSKDIRLENTSYTVGFNRYMDGCSHAIISANDWYWLLGDTVLFLDSGCTKTNFNATKIIKWEAKKHDIATSYKWKLEQWQQKAIKECGTKICLYEKNQATQPGRAGTVENP